MTIEVLKSKIQKAVVTESKVEYRGSITLCPKLMLDANIYEYEKVDVNNATNGNRAHTYVLKGKKGDVCINGALSKLFNKGDSVHILSYGSISINDAIHHKPIVINE